MGDKTCIYDTLASYEITLISDYFAVIVFNFEDYGSFIDDKDNPDEGIKLMQCIGFINPGD